MASVYISKDNANDWCKDIILALKAMEKEFMDCLEDYTKKYYSKSRWERFWLGELQLPNPNRVRLEHFYPCLWDRNINTKRLHEIFVLLQSLDWKYINLDIDEATQIKEYAKRSKSNG